MASFGISSKTNSALLFATSI